MKRGFQTVTLLVPALSLFLLCGIIGPTSAISDTEGRDHSVIKGDTLWDITQEYLANPFFWPKVWQYNPQVENPHLIYPGDRIRIPSPEELARMGVTRAPAAREAGPVIQGPIAYVGGYLVARDLFESSGFVQPYKEEMGVGAVLSAWEEKDLLTDRDLVHVNLGARDGAKVGDLFEVIHEGDDVVHPVSRKKLGKQATVQGILKMKSVGEKVSTARIIKTYDPIMVGDRLRPYHPQPLIGPADLNEEDKSIQGVIVQNMRGKDNLAVRDTVYIDVGSEDAVTPGDRFIIYRSGTPPLVSHKVAERSGIREYPPDIMGELVVLKTMKETATAVVVEELYEIVPGDRLKYSPQSLPPIKKYDLD